MWALAWPTSNAPSVGPGSAWFYAADGPHRCACHRSRFKRPRCARPGLQRLRHSSWTWQGKNHLPDLSMEAAACIGCGGCVAACPNSSAMLFVAAKVSDLGLLPQGQAERNKRMVRKMNELGFGNCRNHYECEAACPAEINATFISRLNRDYVAAVTREAVAV